MILASKLARLFIPSPACFGSLAMPRYARLTAKCHLCDSIETYSIMLDRKFEGAVLRIRPDDMPSCWECIIGMACNKVAAIYDTPLTGLHQIGQGVETHICVCEALPLRSGKLNPSSRRQGTTHKDVMRASRSPRRQHSSHPSASGILLDARTFSARAGRPGWVARTW